MTGLARAGAAFLILGGAALLSACASHPPALAPNVHVGGSLAVLPTPLLEPNAAPPGIQAMYFSSLDIVRPGRWSGKFITPTNVASVEVRTNLFSIDVPRTAYGRFAFTLNILDTPPIFVRAYRLRVIARNTAGATSETDVPFEIR